MVAIAQITKINMTQKTSLIEKAFITSKTCSQLFLLATLVVQVVLVLVVASVLVEIPKISLITMMTLQITAHQTTPLITKLLKTTPPMYQLLTTTNTQVLKIIVIIQLTPQLMMPQLKLSKIALLLQLLQFWTTSTSQLTNKMM